MAKRTKKQVEVVETAAPVVEKDAAGNVISHAAPLPVVTIDDLQAKMREQARRIAEAEKSGNYADAQTFVLDVEMPLDYKFNRGKGSEFLYLESRLVAVKVGGYSALGGDGARIQLEFGVAEKQTLVRERWATPEQGVGSTYWEFESEATLNANATIFEGRVYLQVKEVNTHSGGWRRASAEGIRYFAKCVSAAAEVASQMPAVHATVQDAR